MCTCFWPPTWGHFLTAPQNKNQKWKGKKGWVNCLTRGFCNKKNRTSRGRQEKCREAVQASNFFWKKTIVSRICWVMTWLLVNFWQVPLWCSGKSLHSRPWGLEFEPRRIDSFFGKEKNGVGWDLFGGKLKVTLSIRTIRLKKFLYRTSMCLPNRKISLKIFFLERCVGCKVSKIDSLPSVKCPETTVLWYLDHILVLHVLFGKQWRWILLTT